MSRPLALSPPGGLRRPAAAGAGLARFAAVAACAAALLAPRAARADRTVPYEEILDGPAKSVVAVRYTLRPKERPEGGEGPKTRKLTTGIVTGPPGQVVIHAGAFPDPDDGPDVLEPTDFRILVRDGVEIAAEAIGVSRDLNLAFLRANDPAQLGGLGVDFQGASRVTLGDEVIVIGLLSEPYGFRPAAYRAHLNARPPGPRVMYSLDQVLPDLCGGGLVVKPDGRPVGLLGLDLLPEDWDGAEAGNLLSLFGSANQGQRPGYLMFYPAASVADLIASPPPLPSAEQGKQGWLGITMQPLGTDLSDYWGIKGPGGVVLGAVFEGSPAHAAGLRPGDVVVAIDGDPLPVRDQRDLALVQKRIRRAGAGRDVPLTVWRDGTTREVSVQLSASPASIATAEELKDQDFGLSVRELTYDVRQALNLGAETRGVIVSQIERGGWAGVGGIERGDIILKADGEPITDLATMRAALSSARTARRPESLFLVLRAFKTRFVRVKTDWK